MRRLALLVVLVAFTFSCGGQWCVLQGIAWANMIREYSAVVPLAEAIHMTLSGEYPCALCKAIAEKKQADDSKFAFAAHEKKIVSPGFVAKNPAPNVSPQTFIVREQFFQTWSGVPPTPPPRLA